MLENHLRRVCCAQRACARIVGLAESSAFVTESLCSPSKLPTPSTPRRARDAGAQVASLAGGGDLEARLKAAEPRWRSEFCSDADRPPGAPSLLLVGPSAAEANSLIKRLPAFNEVRRDFITARMFAVWMRRRRHLTAVVTVWRIDHWPGPWHVGHRTLYRAVLGPWSCEAAVLGRRLLQRAQSRLMPSRSKSCSRT